MKTLEKRVEKNTIKEPGEKKRSKGKKKISILIDFILYGSLIGILIGFFLLYGPMSGFRNWYITTAMTTMHHQYLATWFYSAETINEVLSNNKVIEVDGITDTSQIIISEGSQNNENDTNQNYANEYERAVLEKDSKHPDYKLIDIKEKNYEGYLAVVYDASKIHTLVTEKLNRSGQYVTTMAKNKKAVLAINGGGFEDLNHNSTGGTPLGLTFANGKLITNRPYSGPGGLIGFDENDKLILGKMSAEKAKSMKIRDAVTCGPFLIINGKSSEVLGNGGWGTAPRTAIGQRKDGIVLMLVVDGRRVGMPGADMDDLIEIMERYGAYNASALDGGTSSVMVENYELINDPIDSTGAHKTRPIATGFGVILDEDN
ncbi:MAG: phosphodiester glycosidase family protein [Clostridia bacterium]|nr:phosphodiester glycosidase family protein [Clostridia bacterium]